MSSHALHSAVELCEAGRGAVRGGALPRVTAVPATHVYLWRYTIICGNMVNYIVLVVVIDDYSIPVRGINNIASMFVPGLWSTVSFIVTGLFTDCILQ